MLAPGPCWELLQSLLAPRHIQVDDNGAVSFMNDSPFPRISAFEGLKHKYIKAGLEAAVAAPQAAPAQASPGGTGGRGSGSSGRSAEAGNGLRGGKATAAAAAAAAAPAAGKAAAAPAAGGGGGGDALGPALNVWRDMTGRLFDLEVRACVFTRIVQIHGDVPDLDAGRGRSGSREQSVAGVAEAMAAAAAALADEPEEGSFWSRLMGAPGRKSGSSGSSSRDDGGGSSSSSRDAGGKAAAPPSPQAQPQRSTSPLAGLAGYFGRSSTPTQPQQAQPPPFQQSQPKPQAPAGYKSIFGGGPKSAATTPAPPAAPASAAAAPPAAAPASSFFSRAQRAMSPLRGGGGGAARGAGELAGAGGGGAAAAAVRHLPDGGEEGGGAGGRGGGGGLRAALRRYNVSATSKWEAFSGTLPDSDPTLAAVQDPARRQQLFVEVVAELQLAAALAAAAQGAELEFTAMLAGLPDVTSTSTWSLVRRDLAADPRCQALPEKRRRELFEAYTAELFRAAAIQSSALEAAAQEDTAARPPASAAATVAATAPSAAAVPASAAAAPVAAPQTAQVRPRSPAAARAFGLAPGPESDGPTHSPCALLPSAPDLLLLLNALHPVLDEFAPRCLVLEDEDLSAALAGMEAALETAMRAVSSKPASSPADGGGGAAAPPVALGGNNVVSGPPAKGGSRKVAVGGGGAPFESARMEELRREQARLRAEYDGMAQRLREMEERLRAQQATTGEALPGGEGAGAAADSNGNGKGDGAAAAGKNGNGWRWG
ncbi:hypothetical protein TSOC_008362 [Tetrabaena socialis]|uniref:FF domain-containing protein n=1 Tax=Tetrabaena socialis TaxID=47790 RepID=A0A2J7ZYM4_9CHLO|nr:hypothetical protein TSOC_008362 [Tetrabaena socialis]|eukprot:PNH05373.1 hypothetical protein TSOC_008362 [Tetrabaena socialis]